MERRKLRNSLSLQKKQDSLINEVVPAPIAFCLLVIVVFCTLLTILFCILTNEVESQIDRIETRIEHLEDRVGADAVLKGKTGLNREW